MADGSDLELLPGTPRWWPPVAAVEVLVLCACGLLGKIAGVPPFAEQHWPGILVGAGVPCWLAVAYWRAARRDGGRDAGPGAAEPGWSCHAVAGCLAFFLGVLCVFAVGDLLWHWFVAESAAS